MKKILVIGHKKPDTDSVVASIALSYLKNITLHWMNIVVLMIV